MRHSFVKMQSQITPIATATAREFFRSPLFSKQKICLYKHSQNRKDGNETESDSDFDNVQVPLVPENLIGVSTTENEGPNEPKLSENM